jgi:hypothetical protein
MNYSAIPFSSPFPFDFCCLRAVTARPITTFSISALQFFILINAIWPITTCIALPVHAVISPYTAYHMTTQLATNPQVGTGTTPSYQRHKHPTENVYSAHYSCDVHASIINFDELRATQQFCIAKVHDRNRQLI